ncbi:MAG: class I SAM-dependent methyltransferase [Hyphomicrobiaceae bacterium]
MIAPNAPPVPPGPADGLPWRRWRIEAAGRTWDIEAVSDQTALLEAADAFRVFPFGLMLWESALALADELARRRDILARASVLEIGAGVGLAGLAAAGLGAVVTQSDHLPAALDACRRNAALNGLPPPRTLPADWNDWPDATRYDIVIGADVLYERDVFPAVASILERNVGQGGLAILADPGRPQTPEMIELLEAAGWRVALHRRSVAALQPSFAAQTIDVTIIAASRG